MTPALHTVVDDPDEARKALDKADKRLFEHQRGSRRRRPCSFCSFRRYKFVGRRPVLVKDGRDWCPVYRSLKASRDAAFRRWLKASMSEVGT